MIYDKHTYVRVSEAVLLVTSPTASPLRDTYYNTLAVPRNYDFPLTRDDNTVTTFRR